MTEYIEEEILTIIGPLPVTSILRVKNNKESYIWTCVCDYFWGDKSVLLKAALTAPTVNQARMVKNYLKDKGIKLSRWERRNGKTRQTAVRFR